KIDSKAHRAKGSAKDILYSDIDVFRLLPSDKRLHFFQNIRDEAHNQAIEFHRKQKIKSDKKISLLAISGIGEAKMKKLISYFGSFEAIENAQLDELELVISQKDAKLVFDYFN
ncbi:MAG: excinuclease subunit, partial [Campylobacterota bacterium]|nr:excinuclease subunit [Campylobacterota bacterium]